MSAVIGTKICKTCGQKFDLDQDDLTFYKKVNVPPPTLCPKCRLVRRLAWRNDLTFYSRECDMCRKKIVSLYHPDKPLTVYCNKCWWSDSWDPKDYGREINFSKPFFDQFRELQDRVPLPALFNDNGVGSVNCEYTQNTTFAKNCYMGAMTWKSEDLLYYCHIAGPETRYVVDSRDIFHHSQILYDCVFLEHAYNCRSCYYSTGLTDCALVYDCKGCSNCFMCANLREKSYCILNKQYSKEEYQKILDSYELHTYSGAQKAKKEFLAFLPKQVRRFANIRNCVNCTGDGLFNDKNVRDAIFARGCEDVRFLWRGNDVKDSYDLAPAGETAECYEGLTPDHDFQVLFSIYSLKSQYLSYVENCHSSKHLFGCSGMRYGRYSILNKEYPKDEYFALRDRLIEHMKKTGEYGEFFPAGMSHFGYNETMADEEAPLSREDALKSGFRWWDKLQRTSGQETLRPHEIADSIHDIPDSILNEILACSSCGRNYKIVPDELIFYRLHAIPVPRQCFYCRNRERFQMENPFHLWHRQCMCDKATHSHPEKCLNEFETSYAPGRPEIVYCEQCYNAEVV